MSWFNYSIVILGMLISIALFLRPKKLKSSKYIITEEIRKVSIIIPARNEEINLKNILSDIKNLEYPIHEVICVDDQSTDNTADVIDQFSANKVSVEMIPNGWKGKTWACQLGAETANGEILLFIDADVRLEPQAVNSLVHSHLQFQSPISVQPTHHVIKVYEYLSLFFNMIQVAATGLGFMGSQKTYGLFGPIFLISRNQFFALNGYNAVKGKVVEDFSLGQYYKRNNVHPKMYLGDRLISYRMYPHGIDTLIEGWAKNFSLGAISTRWWLLLMIVIWVVYLTVTPILLTIAIIQTLPVLMWIFIAVYLFSVLMLARTGNMLGNYPNWCYLLYPVFIVFFHIMFGYSTVATFVLKSTTWKGRKL